MIEFFKKKPKSYLGIDIGTSSIKVVQLKRQEIKPKLETYGFLETYGSIKLTTTPIQTSSLKILDDQVASMLEKLLKETEVTTNFAIMSIPVFSTFSAIMELPEMPESEIASAINYEARQYIPIPLDEVVLDWSIIGKKTRNSIKGATNPITKLQILLLAIPKELARKYTNITEMLGLELKVLEAEPFSLVRSLVGEDKAPIIIIDIGRRTTSINIIDKGYVMTSRAIDTSGDEFTKVLNLGLNIDFYRAESLKKDIGLTGCNGEAQISKIMFPVVDIIASETQRLIDLYFRRNSKRIEKIILSGGSARLPGLVDYFAKTFGLACFIGNPWKRVIYPEVLKPTLREIGSYFSVAVGLAMRGVSNP